MLRTKGYSGNNVHVMKNAYVLKPKFKDIYIGGGFKLQACMGWIKTDFDEEAILMY